MPGARDQIVALLIGASADLPAFGCHVYIVSIDNHDDDRIWIYEVWDSAEAHRASLELPATRAAIAEAMPLLTGEFTAQESSVVGGLGG